MEVLQTAPPDLTRTQRRIFWATTVVVALTRLWARSKTIWDWDEALFALATRSYDVVTYRPHPPGFPLYIGAAKLLRSVFQSDFHALQAVVIIGAAAIFPLLFLLSREMRFGFATAWTGSLLFVFLPDVWLFGGTAFSDVPALALTLAACAVLLRGCRDRRAYFAGAVLLGLASAMRPQALIIGCASALVASWCRRDRWKDIAGATLLGASVIAVSYWAAALASSSVLGYIDTGRKLREYLRKVDSFLNPDRPGLTDLLSTYFVHPIPGGRIAVALSIAAAAGLVIGIFRRRPAVWLIVMTFLPFNIFAWLMLDLYSISRYAVSYAPMYALLAAEGVITVASIVPVVGEAAGVLAIVAMAARFGWWALPGIREVRRTPSPPVAAARWVNANVPRSQVVWVHGSMEPFAGYFFEGRPTDKAETPRDIPPSASIAGDYVVIESSSSASDARIFVRSRDPLYEMARQRYFEVAVIPAREWLIFGDGWYGDEWNGATAWRWAGPRSTALLPALSGKARLSLEFDTPSEKGLPTIEVSLNGKLVERFTCSSDHTARSWVVDARGDGWNELQLVSDRVSNPAREGTGADGRDLAICLRKYTWAPAGR